MNPYIYKITPRFLLLCFILGAVGGSLGDFVHVVTHTDGYPPNGPFPFIPLLPVKMPIWVPFLFGTAGVLMGLTHRLAISFYQPALASNQAFSRFAPLLFVILYALSGFIQLGTGSWQDAWLALAAILLWWQADGTITGAVLAVLIALCGTAFEIFLVHIGGFFYYPQNSNLLGVPSWLPWLYVAASVCVSFLARWESTPSAP